MHKVQVTPLIGLPQFDGWSQVATNDDSSLAVALAVGGVNAGNVGRDLVAALTAAHPQTAAELHTLLLTILHQATTVGSQIALAASCVIGDVSMFAAYQGAVMLKRGAKSGIIINAPDSIKVIEGKHTIEDVIVLTTFQAMTFVGEVQQKLSQGYDVDTIVTSLVPGLHSAADSALSCIAFISFDQTVQPIEEKPLFEFELETVEEPESEEEEVPPLVTSDVIGTAEVSPQMTPEITPEFIPSPPGSRLLRSLADEETTEDTNYVHDEFSHDHVLDTTLETPSRAPAKSGPLQVTFSSTTSSKLAGGVKTVVGGITKILSKIGHQLWRVAKGIPRLLQNIFNRLKPLFSNAQYVSELSRKKILQYGAPILVAMVLVIAGGLWWRHRATQQVQAAVVALQPLEEKFETAKNEVASNPLDARATMETTLSEIEALKNTFAKQVAALKIIDERHAAAQSVFDTLSGRDEFSTLPVFFDLRTVQSDILVSKGDAQNGKAVLLDPEKKHLVVLNLNDKSSQAVKLDSIAKLTNVSINPDLVVILGSGVRSLPLADLKTELKIVKEEGDSNREAILTGSFGPYIYVVNPAKRNIFRYAPSGQSYSEPVGWLKPGQSLPYDQLNSLAIDGDVWFGTRDGTIVKLTQGSRVAFEIKGLPQALAGPIMVFTKETTENLYVLEPGANRVVILKKTGEFVREVKSGSLASATAIFADEGLNKAFAINGSLIFEIGL